MALPFILFHWSPVSRRKQVQRRGLCPGSRSRSRCGQWNPPYVCFSHSPSQAWALSAAMMDEPGEWDLWMVWSNVPSSYKTRSNDGSGKPTEYRVYERIWKRDIWYVGTRSYHPRYSSGHGV